MKAWHVPYQDRTPEQMEEWQAELQRQLDSISKALPNVPYMNAFVRAQDNMTADYATYLVGQGEDPQKAIVHCGSYSRMKWAYEHLPKQVLWRELPDLWAMADPDDTDPTMLDMWKEAYKGGGLSTRKDGPLPWAANSLAYLTIFRGQDDTDAMGISWTTDYKVAEKFRKGAAYRIGSMDGVLLMGHVMPHRVLGYMSGRGESEVVVDPADVTDIYVARPLEGDGVGS
jgi:hypothetical protein